LNWQHPNMATGQSASKYEIAAWVLAGVTLLLVLKLRLLPALLAGLLVYELVHILAPRLHIVRISEQRRKLVAVTLLSALIVVFIALAIVGVLAFLRSDTGSLPALLAKMADILDSSRTRLPPWIAQRLPASPAALRATAADWLRLHAGALQSVGKQFGLGLAHVLIGLIIGAMVSLREARQGEARGPLAIALFERARRLGDAFRRIVFAQVRISALNTLLTGIYLAAVLPLLGIHLPLVKTMILVTFLAGLLPVIGNLISNTVIVIVSLSYSGGAAIGSLAFLVFIHKLEYFVNARIVGTQIRARAWELLLAMLVMEAAFGLPGLIAAPIYYAYLKDELASRGLI
jgi:predicted PurR-regulated permease PerM